VAASSDSTQAYEHGQRVGYQTGERAGYQKATTEAFSTPMVPHDRGTWLATGHTAARIPLGGAVRFRAGAVEGFLINPGQGQPIYALSAACTHMGCMITWLNSARTFLCPCHGAQYNPDGSVLSGIARNPLPPLRVRSDKTGRLYVWTVGEHPSTTTVEPYTRP
jgi:Rieske Fe-S protein